MHRPLAQELQQGVLYVAAPEETVSLAGTLWAARPTRTTEWAARAKRATTMHTEETRSTPAATPWTLLPALLLFLPAVMTMVAMIMMMPVLVTRTWSVVAHPGRGPTAPVAALTLIGKVSSKIVKHVYLYPFLTLL